MRKLKIYLDNCCFNRPYDDQTQDIIMLETTAKLLIQKLVSKKQLNLVWSYILKFENSRNVYEAKKNAIAGWRKLSIEYVDQSSEIESLAKEIMQSGMKEADALHVACAISAECDHFITVDKRVLKFKSDKITICNPLQFMSIYEGGEE